MKTFTFLSFQSRMRDRNAGMLDVMEVESVAIVDLWANVADKASNGQQMDVMDAMEG